MEGFLPSSRKKHVYTQSAGGRHHVEVEKEKSEKSQKRQTTNKPMCIFTPRVTTKHNGKGRNSICK